MSDLHPLVRQVPRILYALAVLFFVWSFVLTVTEANMTMTYADDPVLRQALMRGLYQAALEGLYIAANGVIVQVLIAIWEKASGPGQGGGE